MVALDDSSTKIHLECGTLEENDHHCASQPCINGKCYGGIDDFFCIDINVCMIIIKIVKAMNLLKIRLIAKSFDEKFSCTFKLFP